MKCTNIEGMSLTRNILPILFALSPVLSFAQQGTLAGNVYDKQTQETLIGASVVMMQDKARGAATDLDGNYRFQMPVGTHRIVCSFTGMKADTVTVQIFDGRETRWDFALENFAEQLGVVVVSSGRYEQRLEELTVSMDVLRPEVITAKAATNITQVLEQTPGLTIMDEEPQIRSGSGYSFGVGSRVAILVDDLPVMSGDISKVEWSFIPMENIEQIEVIKGASSVLYGSSALSGAINVRTAYPRDEPQTKVILYTGFRSAILDPDASGGRRFANFFGLDGSAANGKKWWDGVANISGMNFFHSRKIKQWDVVIGGNINYDYGYIGPHPQGSVDALGDSIPDIVNNDVREVRGRINFNLRRRSKKVSGLAYGVNGNFMRNSKNFSLVWNSNENNPNGRYLSYPGTMTLTEITTFYIDPFITYVTSRGVQHSLKTRVLYTDNDNSMDQSSRSTVFMGDYQLQRTLSKMRELNVIAGASGSYTTAESEVYVGGNPSGDNNAKNFSLYMQFDKRFWSSLNLSLGVRGEYFQINDLEFVVRPVFRSGLSFKAGKATFIRASFGQGYRFPTIGEKYILTVSGGLGVFPNPDLQPETSWNLEGGVKQGFKVGKFYGYFDFVAFWQEFRNSVDIVMGNYGDDTSLPGFKFLNTGDNRVRGIEASIMGGGQLTKDFGMTLVLGYTYTVPESLNPDEVFHVNRRTLTGEGDTLVIVQEFSHYSTSIDSTNILKYRFRHLGKLDVEFSYRKWSMGYSFRYYSFMENIDRVLYDLDILEPGLNSGIIEDRGDRVFINDRGRPEWEINRDKNSMGDYVMDARISFQATKWLKAAFIVNNFLNNEYSLRPLRMEQPRTAMLQLSFTV
jgi:outer membrane cobalamin receptor